MVYSLVVFFLDEKENSVPIYKTICDRLAHTFWHLRVFLAGGVNFLMRAQRFVPYYTYNDMCGIYYTIPRPQLAKVCTQCKHSRSYIPPPKPSSCP